MVKVVPLYFPSMAKLYKISAQHNDILLALPIFFLLSVFSSPSFLFASPLTSATIAPERDIVTIDTSKAPEWKALWDEAREMTRQGRYSEAAKGYAKLLSVKKNIEEASWEYSLVLIALSHWEQAAFVLEGLLERDPLRSEYLLSAGSVALKMKEYGRAAAYYRRVTQKSGSSVKVEGKDGPVSLAPGREYSPLSVNLEKDPSQQGTEALIGLVAALHGAGKSEEAFPLMEQLFLLRPNDTSLLHQLAVHAVKSGRHEMALVYYEKLIANEAVDDRVLLEAAEVFERSGERVRTDRRSQLETVDTKPSLAFVCWEKYLQRHPDYLPFQKKIADYFLARGEKKAALPHLLVLLSQDENRDKYLLPVGSIYLFDLGRPDKALSFYEEYFQLHPENKDVALEIAGIQAKLAHDLVGRVDREGAGLLWKELAPITPNRLAIYTSMIQLLEQQGNRKELTEVLTIIHQHDPLNREVILRLAELELEQNRPGRVDNLLDLLPQEELKKEQKARYFLIRGRYADQREIFSQALGWYEQYLELESGVLSVRLRCMELSASLGLIKRYEEHYQLARRDVVSEQDRLHLDLQYAKVLLANGLVTRAGILCRQLINDGQGGDVFLAECHFALADALYREENSFEAEQVLRQMLMDGVKIEATLYKLVEFEIESRELDLAQVWFQLLSDRSGHTAVSPVCGEEELTLPLLQARILAASGKFGKAIEVVRGYREVLAQHCPKEAGTKKQADLLLCHFYLLDNQVDKGRKLIAEMHKAYPLDLEVRIIEQQLEVGRSGKGQGGGVDDLLEKTYGNEFVSLMRASQLEQKYGDRDAAHKHIRMALQAEPESLAARVAIARILQEQGESEAAVAAWQSLVAEYPQELGFGRHLLEGEFKQGLFKQIITKLSPSRPEGLGKTLMALPDTGHLLTWQRLMLARALWAERQWVEAVAVYDTLLQPSVEKIFTEKITENQIEIVLPSPRQSLWNMITFTAPPEPDRLSQVMDPVFVLRQRGEPAGRIGTELYAEYRWQQLAARELSARRALAQGDYYQAMKEYLEVTERDPSPESLFDLAGIYSRLGLLGKEALLYEEIAQNNPDYPELAAAVERNSLKREPKGMLDFGYSSQSGRDGYLDMKQTRGGGSVWMLPTLRQEMSAGWSTIHAVSENTDQDVWRNRFLAEYSFYPHYAIDFIAKIGGDKIGDTSDTEAGSAHYDIIPLYHFETRGRIGDELHGFVRITQDVVDDTVQALKQGISKRDMEGGVSVDLLPRLFCGGEYSFSEYSDTNHQNRYHVWASYLLFTEPTLLRVTYGQQLLHNDESNLGQNFTNGSLFSPDDHPYWSPSEYWQNQVSVHFEHHLAADVLGRSAPSYYTLDYSIGYEEGGYDSHSFGGDIFLEMSRHFLLNSSFDMIQGGQEIRKDVALSLVYRW
jgi:tetratricopeptide (TPR) repeat protein